MNTSQTPDDEPTPHMPPDSIGNHKPEPRYGDASRPVWHEVERLAERNPEAAMEWLRMAITIEVSNDKSDVDFVVHAEEGVKMIRAITERHEHARSSGDLRKSELRRAASEWISGRASCATEDRSRMARSKQSLRRKPSEIAWDEMKECAFTDPELYREFLTMLIRTELCKTESDMDAIAYWERGIDITNQIIEYMNKKEEAEES